MDLEVSAGASRGDGPRGELVDGHGPFAGPDHVRKVHEDVVEVLLVGAPQAVGEQVQLEIGALGGLDGLVAIESHGGER